ncbi:MAG TPA: hypothetical protein VGH31_02330 [Acidimicrobiales bacterium]|jgi:hypothetical protein
MRWGRRSNSAADGAPSKPGLWLRFQNAIVKPDDPDGDAEAKAELATRPLADLEAESKTLSDKERAIGFIAAPFGALITFIIVTVLDDHDPAPYFKNGKINAAHVNPSLYHELFFVLLGMSVLMLVTSFLRKRTVLGVVLGLFGLGIFNLHYWGFGIPFVLAGAWYLVRAYRLSQSIKAASGGGSVRGAYKAKPRGLPSAGGVLPRPNKRYTPPTAPSRRKPRSEPNPS